MSASGQMNDLCVSRIKSYGGLATRINSGKIPASYTRRDGSKAFYLIKLAEKGWSDVIGFIDRTFIACEIKIGDDLLNEDQLRFLLGVIDQGGVALVVRDDPALLTDLLTAITDRHAPQRIALKLTRRHMIGQVLTDYLNTHRALPDWSMKYWNEIKPEPV